MLIHCQTLVKINYFGGTCLFAVIESDKKTGMSLYLLSQRHSRGNYQPSFFKTEQHFPTTSKLSDLHLSVILVSAVFESQRVQERAFEMLLAVVPSVVDQEIFQTRTAPKTTMSCFYCMFLFYPMLSEQSNIHISQLLELLDFLRCISQYV